jgi:hypothetical protein
MPAMPDDHDTDPEIPIPEEQPTRPDLRLVTCPKCHGQGTALHKEWAGTVYRGTMQQCSLCGGRKRVDHVTLARFHAERKGRPHT